MSELTKTLWFLAAAFVGLVLFWVMMLVFKRWYQWPQTSSRTLLPVAGQRGRRASAAGSRPAATASRRGAEDIPLVDLPRRPAQAHARGTRHGRTPPQPQLVWVSRRSGSRRRRSGQRTGGSPADHAGRSPGRRGRTGAVERERRSLEIRHMELRYPRQPWRAEHVPPSSQHNEPRRGRSGRRQEHREPHRHDGFEEQPLTHVSTSQSRATEKSGIFSPESSVWFQETVLSDDPWE